MVLDRFLGFSGDLDTSLFGRLRSGGGGNIFLFLYGDGSRDRSDLGFSCSRWFVTGRVNFFRFRRRVIDIVDVSSPIGLGGSVVDSGPPAVNDKFVQDLLRPGNADSSEESALTLVKTNGTRPLPDKRGFRDLQSGTDPGAELLRAYLIKGSGDDDLPGVVWPGKRKMSR